MEGGASSRVEVEIVGLSVYTHHGVTDAEREIGQRLVLDISFDVPGCEAVASDRLEDTVDYGEVSRLAAATASEGSHLTLERVAGLVAERLMESFRSSVVRVRAAKPEPPLALAVEEVAVAVVRSRAGDGGEPAR